MQPQWKITAAQVGALSVPRALLSGGGADSLTSAPIIMWILQSENGVVVFDTGTPPPESPAALRHGLVLERKPGESLESTLEIVGVNPLDVQFVVISHLHWDHSSNIPLFANARVIVQERELVAAFRPPEGQERAYESPAIGLTPSWVDAVHQFELVDGDLELLPGLTVLHLPGHTPGSQGLLVQTADGTYILAGDLVPVASNLASDPPILPGVVSSLADAVGSLQRLAKLPARVLGSHDPELFPPGSPSLANVG